MERFEDSPESKLDQERPHGADVTVHAFFVRHGATRWDPKLQDHVLSDDGIELSASIGDDLKDADAIKAYSSGKTRSDWTADLLVEHSHIHKKMRHVVTPELLFNFDPNSKASGGFVAQKEQVADHEKLLRGYENASEDEKKNIMQHVVDAEADFYLSFGDKRPDPKTFSPLESAACLADRIQTFISMTDRLKSHSTVDLINVSHDYALASILKYTLVREIEGKKEIGFSKIEEIGGAITHDEFFDIEIKTDDHGQKTISLKLRDHDYGLSEEAISTLANFYKIMELSKEFLGTKEDQIRA